jgi:hypothetical protein
MTLGGALRIAAAFSFLWIGEVVGADAVLHGTVSDGLTGRRTPCTVTITDLSSGLAGAREGLAQAWALKQHSP